MKKKRVYFDNGATTKVASEVIDAIIPYFNEIFGNASSMHKFGIDAKETLEESRKVIAESIGANPEEIIFTSGGTESNNFAIKGIAFSNRDKGNHIITTKIEHDCVLNSCKWLETQGFKVTYLDVDKDGFVSPEVLKSSITDDTILVSVIHGNNEIGTIQDLEQLGDVCRNADVYFHTDACQSFTKTKLDVSSQPIDLITLNAHKIHGPKGVGALYVKKGVSLKAWQHGGGHEKNLRSGTENIHGIVGFAKAVELAMDSNHIKRMRELRNKLVKKILDSISGTKLNGPDVSNGDNDKRLCNNVNISFNAVEGEALLALLDIEGVAVSTGSACSTNILEPSHVLLAIGDSYEEANGALRLTLSRYSTEEDVDFVVDIISKVVKKLRDISPIALAR